MEHAIIFDPIHVDITVFAKPTELRDKSGTLLGVFTPASVPSASELESKLSLQELRAIVAEPGGYSLNEIWRELGVRSITRSYGRLLPKQI